MKDIVIFGGGGQYKVIRDIIRKSNQFNIIGIVDDHKKIGDLVNDYPVVGTIDSFISNPIANAGIIAIGDNWIRSKIALSISKHISNFEFVNLIHPSAIIGENTLFGCGNVVMAGAHIGTYSTIGNHCIINTNASIDHDCILKDFSSMGPNAVCGGQVSIGNYSAICLSANIIHGITIEDQVIVGSGALVINNIENNAVIIGVPGKLLRHRLAGDSYL